MEPPLDKEDPRQRADSILSDATPPNSPRRRGSLDLSTDDERRPPSTDSVLAEEIRRDILDVQDPVVATAWIVLLVCGAEACSVVCTARLLQAWPFALSVACAELLLGPLTALPFWICGARPWPSFYGEDVPRFWFPAALALAGASCAATFAADSRGAPIVRDVDIDGAWRSLAATRRDVAAAYASLSSFGSGKVAASSTSKDVLATFDRLGPRSALAPSRAMLEALGAYAGANPRPSSTTGAAAAVAAALVASHLASLASSTETPGFLNRAGEPTSKLGVLACLAFGSGLLAATWHAAAHAHTALGVDERPPANVASSLSLLAGLLLLPYAYLVQGPEAFSYDAGSRVVYLVVTAAFASQLKRELQVHALRSLPPGAAAVLGAGRGLAVALAVAAGA